MRAPPWKIIAPIVVVVLLLVRLYWGVGQRNEQIQITVDSIQQATEKIRLIPSAKKPSDNDIKNAESAVSLAQATLASHRTNPPKNADREQIKAAINNLQEECEKLILAVLGGDELRQKDVDSFDRRVEYGRYFAEMKDEHIKLLSNPARQMLENNQRETWEAAEELTRLTLKDLIGRIKKISPTPVVALEKLKECLESLKTRWTELDREIPASKSGRTMMEDIETILDFCKDRLKYGIYQVTEFSVSGEINFDGKYDIGFIKRCNDKGEGTGDCRTITVSNQKVVPPRDPVHYNLPLGKETPVMVRRASNQSSNRLKLFEGEVSLKEPPTHSLKVFGMPLIWRDRENTKVLIENARVELEMKIQHEYILPDLFWTALE